MIPLPLLVAQLVTALGAALLLGTVAALIRYWRTGRFPNQPDDVQPDPADVRAAVRFSIAKAAAGLFLLVWGIASLDAKGFI